MAGPTAPSAPTRLLLIDRSSRTAHTHPNVKALLSEGWGISRIETRITEARGAQWLVALTNVQSACTPGCTKKAQ